MVKEKIFKLWTIHKGRTQFSILWHPPPPCLQIFIPMYLRPTCVPDEHSKSNHHMLLPLGNLYKSFFVIIISIHFFPSFLRVFLSLWFLFIFFQTFCGLATQKRYNRTFLKGLMVLHSHSKTWEVAYLDTTKNNSLFFFFFHFYIIQLFTADASM